MNTKLTLSLEKEIIEKAKKYAESQHRSLSDLVENYFKALVISEPNLEGEYRTKSVENPTLIVDSLRGIIKENVDLNSERLQRLEEKYL